MGGLEIGNATLGKLADRTNKPLLLCAKLELFISILCALSPFLIDLIRWIYFVIGGQETLGSFGATFVRLAGATLVIGLPAFLMGGTLPAAVRAVTLHNDIGRRAVGHLSGLNTFGAVFGALIGTFYLFEMLGTRTTLWLACWVNLLNSGIAWSNNRGPSEISQRVNSIDAIAQSKDQSHFQRLLSSSQSETSIYVCAAIVGAIYSLVFQNYPPTMRSFILTLTWESLAIAIPFALGDFLAVLAMNLRQFAIFGFWGQASGWLVIAAIVILPAAITSGVQFPILVALIGQGNADVGKQLCKVFVWKTVGAIFGSLAGGFGLMSMLSAPGVWKLVIVVLAMLAISMFLLHRHLVSFRTLLPLTAVIILACLCLFTEGPTAVWRHSGIGAGRNLMVGSTRNEFRAWVNTYRRQILSGADGSESTVAISKRDSNAFIVNGKSDGDAIADAATQIMLGVLGAMLHADPKESLVIGLGTGESAGWLAHLPSIQHVDVVELEPAVLQMAELCKAVNFDVLKIKR